MNASLYSLEAEQAVLGCMLLQPNEVIGDVTLNRDDFFVPAHREVFTTILRTWQSKGAVDVITIHHELVKAKVAEQINSPGILAELCGTPANHLTVSSHIRIVREFSQLRQLQRACHEIGEDIASMPDTAVSVLERAETRVCSIAASYSGGALITAGDAVREYEEWRGLVQGGQIESRIQTGIQALDHANGGLPVPSYVVIAGEQGMGKSALIINIMKNAAMAGLPVGGFTMEMTTNQVVARMVADIGDIDSRLLNKKLHPREEERESKAKESIRSLPIFFDRRSGLTPNDIRTITRQMVREGCKIIWLDNAQLMQGSSAKDKRNEQLTEVSRTIQHLQREHNIVFILLAQVTRESQKRGNMKAFDLADCAAFERDARVVIMLERKPGCENAPAFAVPIVVRTVKYSEGETGDTEATFNKQKQRIQ